MFGFIYNLEIAAFLLNMQTKENTGNKKCEALFLPPHLTH
jgi:hypothetical protein